MKCQENPLIDVMTGNVAMKPKTPKTIQVRCTTDEKDKYDELMDKDVDVPYMVREFIRKLYDEVK